MTNLEFYKDDILRETIKNDNLVCAICKEKYKKCMIETSEQCPFEKDLLLWLCEEYKEPIKLKQWEYDILKHCDNGRRTCIQMKELGYFKDITDTSMSLEAILDKCIIVADDYDFEGKRK